MAGYFIPTFDPRCEDLRTSDKILTRATAVLKLLQHFTEVFPLSKKHIRSFNPKTNFLETVLNQTGEKKNKKNKKKRNGGSCKEISKTGIFFLIKPVKEV